MILYSILYFHLFAWKFFERNCVWCFGDIFIFSMSNFIIFIFINIHSFLLWFIHSYWHLSILINIHSFLLTGCTSNSVESVTFSSRVKYGKFLYNFNSKLQSHEAYFLKIAKKCLHGYADIFQSGQEQDGIVSSLPKSRL